MFPRSGLYTLPIELRFVGHLFSQLPIHYIVLFLPLCGPVGWQTMCFS